MPSDLKIQVLKHPDSKSTHRIYLQRNRSGIDGRPHLKLQDIKRNRRKTITITSKAELQQVRNRSYTYVKPAYQGHFSIN